MNKYINVNELKKKRYIIEEAINPFTGKKCENVIGERRYVTYAEIDEMPSADVRENIHGHWLDSSNGWMCSNCDRDSRSDTNFCPNCGADMRGEIK